MSAPSRVKPSPGLLVRALVALGGVAVAIKRRYRLRMRVTIEYCVV